MTSQDLLGAQRAVYVLAEKPGNVEVDSKQFWYLSLGGLHQEHLKTSVAHLRKQKSESAKTKAQQRALKSTDLQHSLARTLGAQSYDHWREREQPKILDLLDQHGLKRPADLINWKYAPYFAGALKARQISDRIFNSGLPVPRRIFTGVGSYLFAPSGYGRLDIDDVAGRHILEDKDRYIFCRERADEILMRAVDMRGVDGPAYIDLTGRVLMLLAAQEYVGCGYNMLGDNLVDPIAVNPVIRTYNTTPEDRSFELQIFELFREEIERSDAGWVEVIEVPGNQNLVFLKGPEGTFDWIVRDQRDEVLSSNPLHPFFKKDELPTAMDSSQLAARRYFTRGGWAEKLEHDAERRHYEQGGSTGNWPGYDKLIERELLASDRFVMPRRVSGRPFDHFFSHRLDGYRLMVSPLITIDQFMSFATETGWGRTRLEKALKANLDIERDLMSVNGGDPTHLPVSVTWLDAVAYCRDYQQRHDLPVRLLEPDEWQKVAPSPSVDWSRVDRGVRVLTAADGVLPQDPIYEQLGWGVVGGDGRMGENSSHTYRSDGVISFGPNLHWTTNSDGLPFLSVAGFKEWLSGYQSGHAPFACAATGRVAIGAGLFGSLKPVHLAMRHHGAKFGFRLCYVAHPDA
ncbi:hypothetical protein [Aquabacterium sp.]|uniref:hypothetical protein n=1 Tax=Aquabacterium sp. TaxID=1872578 RepID=UPI003BB1B66A